MNKRKEGRKFNRLADQRKSLLNKLASEIFKREKIKTTEAKAKELRRLAEKMITKAKKGDLSTTRYLLRFLPAKTVKRLVSEIAPRYQSRPGGYTRMIKLGPRKSDGAKMSIVELIK